MSTTTVIIMTMMRETHTETETETDRDTETETHREKQRHTERGGRECVGRGRERGRDTWFLSGQQLWVRLRHSVCNSGFMAEVLISPNPNRKLFYVNNPPVLMQAKHFSFTR